MEVARFRMRRKNAAIRIQRAARNRNARKLMAPFLRLLARGGADARKALAEENLALVAQLEEARRVMDETNDPLSRQLRSTHAETLAKESELLRAGEELERILSEGAELAKCCEDAVNRMGESAERNSQLKQGTW